MIKLLKHDLDSIHQFYHGVEWDWVEPIDDQAELDRQWEAYQHGLEETSLGRRLSHEEADHWRPSWLRSSRAFLHVAEFRKLTSMAHRFYTELAEAGGEDLLGERAELERLTPVMQPSKLVRFKAEYPPDPPTLWTTEYERWVGGPHVVGARLVWWCAAAESPTEFGYPRDFFNRLLAQSIWTVIQDNTVMANRSAVSLMGDAASRIHDVINGLTEPGISESLVEPPPKRGPWKGCRFCWDGKTAHFTPQLWKLLSFMWKHRSVDRDQIRRQVWEKEASRSNFDSAKSRVNAILLDEKIPVTISSTMGVVRLEVAEE